MDGGSVATIADVARRRPDAVAMVPEDDQLTHAAVIPGRAGDQPLSFGFVAIYWTQNSLPSGSCMTARCSESVSIRAATDAPASISRLISSSTARRRPSGYVPPAAALMSIWRRFLTSFSSETGWKNNRSAFAA